MTEVSIKSFNQVHTAGYFMLLFYKIKAVVKVDDRGFYSSGVSSLRPCHCFKGSCSSNKYSVEMKAIQ